MSKDYSGLFPSTTGGRRTNDAPSSIKDVAKVVISNLPRNPSELLKKGWKDTTLVKMKENSSSQTFHDPKSGLDVRFDKGEAGENGFRGKDHYHVENPNSTGKLDKYLDKDGNPCAKGSKASHIIP